MLISIEGIPRSGKTAVIRQLRERHSNWEFVDWLQKEPDHEDDMERFLWRASKRAAVQEKIVDLLCQKRVVVVESYSLWFEAAAGPCRATDVNSALSKLVEPPSLCFYLRLPVYEAYMRSPGDHSVIFDLGESHRMLRAMDRMACVRVDAMQEPELTAMMIRSKVALSSK